MGRVIVMLVVAALLGSMLGGAQCVVRCASPAPGKCHHHSQGKTDAPGQFCATAMLAGARADAAPVVIANGAAGTVDATKAVVVGARVMGSDVVDRPARCGITVVLRI